MSWPVTTRIFWLLVAILIAHWTLRCWTVQLLRCWEGGFIGLGEGFSFGLFIFGPKYRAKKRSAHKWMNFLSASAKMAIGWQGKTTSRMWAVWSQWRFWRACWGPGWEWSTPTTGWRAGFFFSNRDRWEGFVLCGGAGGVNYQLLMEGSLVFCHVVHRVL